MSEDEKPIKMGPGHHPNSRANLKTDAGPGCPKGHIHITTYIKRSLAASGGRKARALADKIIALAIAGDLGYAKLVVDRNDGPLGQSIDLTTGGKPMGALLGLESLPDNEIDERIARAEGREA